MHTRSHTHTHVHMLTRTHAHTMHMLTRTHAHTMHMLTRTHAHTMHMLTRTHAHTMHMLTPCTRSHHAHAHTLTLCTRSHAHTMHTLTRSHHAPSPESIELLDIDLASETPTVSNMHIFDPPSSAYNYNSSVWEGLSNTGSEVSSKRTLIVNFDLCISSPHSRIVIRARLGSKKYVWGISNCFELVLVATV